MTGKALAVVEDKPKVPREILEDRYDGLLMYSHSVCRAGESLATAGDYNELNLKLDRLLRRLIEGVTRADEDGESGLIEELEGLIRENLIRRVDELGLAQ